MSRDMPCTGDTVLVFYGTKKLPWKRASVASVGSAGFRSEAGIFYRFDEVGSTWKPIENAKE